MKIWFNRQPTFTETQVVLDHVQLPEPWVQGTEQDYQAYLIANQNDAVPVPEQVTNAQFRCALIDAGIYPSIIRQIINRMSDDAAREKALAWFEYSNVVERKSNYVESFRQVLNLTPLQVDEIFLNADKQGT